VTTEEDKRHARDQGSSKKMREMRTEVRDVPGTTAGCLHHSVEGLRPDLLQNRLALVASNLSRH
jgi:hypothetical protein